MTVRTSNKRNIMEDNWNKMSYERDVIIEDDRVPLLHADDKKREKDVWRGDAKHLSKARETILVVCLFLTQVFAYGFNLSLSVLYPVFADVFNSDRATAALVQSLYSGIGMVLSVFWNRFVIRFGCGVCIIFGACLIVLGIFLAQFAPNIWALLVFIGVFGGIGCSIAGIGPIMIVNANIDKHKNVVLALLPFGASVGQFIFVTLTEFFLEKYGWSGALLLMSGIMGNLIPITIWIEMINKQSTSQKNKASSKIYRLFSLIIFKEWRLHIFFIAYFFFLFGAYAEIRFIVDYAIIEGYEREVGSALASYLGLANGAGRLIGIGLKFVIPGKNLLQAGLFSLICASSHAIILYLESYTYLLFGIIVNGVSAGLIVSMYLTCILEVFSPEEFGPAMSASLIIMGIGSFVGGYTGGYIRDLYGSYDLLFEIAIGMGVLMALLYATLAVSVTTRFKKICK